MKTTHTGKMDAREILWYLGWPGDISVERLVASVYDRAMRSGMVQSAVILGYTFDRGELPRYVRREDRLLIALNALAHFSSDRGLLEMLRFDGTLVSDETLESVEWKAPSPMLPSMYGLYDAYGQEWERDKAEPTAG